MKQVDQIGARESAPPEKRKMVQSTPVPPFSLQKPKREESKEDKHEDESRRHHEEGMHDAVAAQPGRSADVEVFDKQDAAFRGSAGSAPPGTDAAEVAGQQSLVNDLALLGADPGVFEVMMPEGDTLGVSVDHRQQSVMFLLSASNQALAKKLKRQASELQAQLAQRMDTEVGLVVL